jgi:cytoskeletal protein RodZ
MKNFLPLVLMVVFVAALAGAAIGWRFPFLGQTPSSNQIGTGQNATQGQNVSRTRVQRASQPTLQAQNNQTTGQAPDATINPEASNTQQGQSDANQPVPALW